MTGPGANGHGPKPNPPPPWPVQWAAHITDTSFEVTAVQDGSHHTVRLCVAQAGAVMVVMLLPDAADKLGDALHVKAREGRSGLTIAREMPKDDKP